jgi:hypothetical protein
VLTLAAIILAAAIAAWRGHATRVHEDQAIRLANSHRTEK